MRDHLARLAVAALAAASLTGCSDAVVVSQYYSPVGGGYTQQDIGFAASRGPIPVYVRGNPFLGDRDSAGVVAALQRHVSMPNLRFVPAPAPGTSGYRLVLAFGSLTPSADYCGGRPDFPLSGPQAGTHVAATFCLGTYLYSQAQVSDGPSAAPSDPAFDAMMRALAVELFSGI